MFEYDFTLAVGSHLICQTRVSEVEAEKLATGLGLP